MLRKNISNKNIEPLEQIYSPITSHHTIQDVAPIESLWPKLNAGYKMNTKPSKKGLKRLKKYENWYKKKITAQFICALTIYWPNNFSVCVVGKVQGTISKTKKGNKSKSSKNMQKQRPRGLAPIQNDQN